MTLVPPSRFGRGPDGADRTGEDPPTRAQGRAVEDGLVAAVTRLHEIRAALVEEGRQQGETRFTPACSGWPVAWRLALQCRERQNQRVSADTRGCGQDPPPAHPSKIVYGATPR